MTGTPLSTAGDPGPSLDLSESCLNQWLKFGTGQTYHFAFRSVLSITSVNRDSRSLKLEFEQLRQADATTGNGTMDLNVERDGSLLLVNLAGRLDGSNSRDFESSLNSEIGDSNCSVVLDLGELTYISSAGLRAILLITKSVKSKNASMVLCSLPKQIEEVFKISGFDRIIPIHATKNEAVESIGG